MKARDSKNSPVKPAKPVPAVDNSLKRLAQCRVLVLNSSWQPIRIISWQRAMLLMLGDKIEVLDRYEEYVHSPSTVIKLPSVIRLKQFISPQKFLRVPRFSRQHVFMRDNYKCQYCSKQFTTKDLTLDHVLPVARGGKKTWSNIVTCCRKCNQKKGAKTPVEAGFMKFKYPREPSPGFLPDILYYRGSLPAPWKPYLSWLESA